MPKSPKRKRFRVPEKQLRFIEASWPYFGIDASVQAMANRYPNWRTDKYHYEQIIGLLRGLRDRDFLKSYERLPGAEKTAQARFDQAVQRAVEREKAKPASERRKPEQIRLDMGGKRNSLKRRLRGE